MIAYFILVHRYPAQFKRLFKSVYDVNSHYLIHIDKRAGPELFAELRRFLAAYPNAHLLEQQGVVWGGYSMVEAELRGMQRLLALDTTWDFFINLSGQDFPLQSQAAVKSFLRENRGTDFIQSSNQATDRPNTMNRVEHYFTESANGFTGIPVKRPYLTGATPYIGGQWKILSRRSCEFVCTSNKVEKFKSYYRNTLIPDESFFQTVLMNTGYANHLVNDDKRAIIWIPDMGADPSLGNLTPGSTQALIASGEIKLRPKVFTINDLPFLQRSNALFARKFDETVDSEILDALEARLSPVQYKLPHATPSLTTMGRMPIPV